MLNDLENLYISNCKGENKKFTGLGGPEELKTILGTFIS